MRTEPQQFLKPALRQSCFLHAPHIKKWLCVYFSLIGSYKNNHFFGVTCCLSIGLSNGHILSATRVSSWHHNAKEWYTSSVLRAKTSIHVFIKPVGGYNKWILDDKVNCYLLIDFFAYARSSVSVYTKKERKFGFVAYQPLWDI